MANTILAIPCEKFDEHEVEVEFSCYLEKNESYDDYYEDKEYDDSNSCAILDEIKSAFIVRNGFVKNKKDAPKVSDIEFKSVKDEKTKKIIGYNWIHRREIQPNDEIYEKLNKYIDEDSELEDVIDGYNADYDEKENNDYIEDFDNEKFIDEYEDEYNDY